MGIEALAWQHWSSTPKLKKTMMMMMMTTMMMMMMMMMVVVVVVVVVVMMMILFAHSGALCHPRRPRARVRRAAKLISPCKSLPLASCPLTSGGL